MASQMRPSSKQDAPDPAMAYERAQPEKESGQGRLDNNHDAVPEDRPDAAHRAVKNSQQSTRQLNAEDVTSGLVEGNPQHPGQSPAIPASNRLPPQPDHSMHEEEPMGWDQAPTDIHDPRQQRQPRTEGKGGTP